MEAGMPRLGGRERRDGAETWVRKAQERGRGSVVSSQLVYDLSLPSVDVETWGRAIQPLTDNEEGPPFPTETGSNSALVGPGHWAGR